MKNDPELEKLKDSVTKIRKNTDGNLILELSWKTRQQTDQLRSLVEKIGEKTQGSCETETKVLELKDLDELTEKADICQALQDQVEEVQAIDMSAVKSLRKAYSKTQTVVVVLPVEIPIGSFAYLAYKLALLKSTKNK